MSLLFFSRARLSSTSSKLIEQTSNALGIIIRTSCLNDLLKPLFSFYNPLYSGCLHLQLLHLSYYPYQLFMGPSIKVFKGKRKWFVLIFKRSNAHSRSWEIIRIFGIGFRAWTLSSIIWGRIFMDKVIVKDTVVSNIFYTLCRVGGVDGGLQDSRVCRSWLFMAMQSMDLSTRPWLSFLTTKLV